MQFQREFIAELIFCEGIFCPRPLKKNVKDLSQIIHDKWQMKLTYNRDSYVTIK